MASIWGLLHIRGVLVLQHIWFFRDTLGRKCRLVVAGFQKLVSTHTLMLPELLTLLLKLVDRGWKVQPTGSNLGSGDILICRSQ